MQLLLQLYFAIALMYTISNHYGIKCVSNLLQLETCTVMFKVISDIMPHWYDLCNTFVIAIHYCNVLFHDLCIDVDHKQSLRNKMS